MKELQVDIICLKNIKISITENDEYHKKRKFTEKTHYYMKKQNRKNKCEDCVKKLIFRYDNLVICVIIL